MGGSLKDAGWGNKPDGTERQWRGKPAGESNIMINSFNHISKSNHNTIQFDTPGCTNPPDYKKSTAFLDSTASLTLLQQQAVCKLAQVQEASKTLGTPNGNAMQTNKTIELLLPKLPTKARKGYTVPNITNNLVFVAELCDARCTVSFHMHGVDC